ncbi:energy transducer TonB [Flavobacterium alvei]|uniref:Energy transducer TonB n=1 Tax=Flavobacterium alvei TaxID=2080416 RepID=A0A2S5AD40_9FLAO|nr:DUF2059 domain-containing protein [Flavobacterium alvei]POY40478.1 energy transducer TonB [Flavobacterium alvei]
MKKVFLSIAFVLIAQMTMAQEANFKADVLKLISISGADGAMKVAKLKFLNIIPENKKENFSKEFEASLPSMYEKMAKVYMEIYTPEDIKGMIAFYESPVGKKMSEKSGELTQKAMKAGQEWGKELQVIMEKYKDVNSVQVPTSVSDNTVYNTAGIEVKPDFPGGMDQFYKFIAENYQTPKAEGLKGKIYVTFVIEKDGSLSDIKVLRDIGYGTGKEAIRVLKLSPKWSPGEQNGQKVRCTYSLPISIGAK